MTGTRADGTVPRPLTVTEAQVIRAIVAEAGVEGSKLLEQLDRAQVLKHWDPSSSSSFDITVPDGSAKAAFSNGVLPVDAYVYDPAGDYLGEVIIWIRDSRLSAVEYAWITDAAPAALPPVNWLRISKRSS